MIRKIVVMLAFVAATFGVVHTASAGEEVKLGTLAPADSAWGKVFKAWAKAVEEESNGGLKLTWYFNGTQGDEAAMVGKVRSKQIDGGAFTATGLSAIYPHIVALQMPGLFPNWAKLDTVREKTKARFEKEFTAQGFTILGTGDVGIAHIMSRGGAVRTPDDLKKFHPFYITGDHIGQKLLETIGVSSPKSMGVTAILPAISSRTDGAVDVINSPAIAAEQLQWSAHVDNVNTMASGIGIGALVMNKERLDGLPADVKAILERTGKNSGELLTKRIRGVDEKAFARMKETKTVIDPTETEKQAWQEVFKKVRNSLKAEGKIKAEVFDEVTNAANN